MWPKQDDEVAFRAALAGAAEKGVEPDLTAIAAELEMIPSRVDYLLRHIARDKKLPTPAAIEPPGPAAEQESPLAADGAKEIETHGDVQG